MAKAVAKRVTEGKNKGKFWIAGAITHPGALRKTAGVKEGETIPVATLERLASQKGTTGKRARLALTLRKLRKG